MRNRKKSKEGANSTKSLIPSGDEPIRKQGVRWDQKPDTDFFLSTKDDYGKTIYDKLIAARKERKYLFSGDGAKYLQSIADEVRLHTKITALSLFSIGELLVEAKRLIAKKTVEGTFQNWIEENFDFSYDTAQNFMHVYTCCIGHRQLLAGIKPTILYKVSEPSFPQELRDQLFRNGAEALRKLTNRDVAVLNKKYETEGWEGISETLAQLTESYSEYQEVAYGMNLLYKIAHDLELQKGQLSKYLSGRRQCIVKPKSYNEATTKIHDMIFKGIEDAVELLDVTRLACQDEVDALSDDYRKKAEKLIGPKLPEPKWNSSNIGIIPVRAPF